MPDFQSAPPEYDPAWARRFVESVEAFQAEQNQPAQVGYAVDNVTETRTFDADTVTLPELADVVGTLIEDLKAVGKLG